MIHEYALDPAIVTDWPSFKYIIDQCGVHHGRLISEFPKDWPTVAIGLCQIQGTKRTAIVDRLKGLKYERKLAISKRIYNDEREWINNALSQHDIKPFHAIIALHNPRNCNYVLIANEIEEGTPLWKVKRGDVIARSAEAIANCARNLIENSKEILFIDPHFIFADEAGKEIVRFYNTLKLIIECSFRDRSLRRFELHLKYKNIHQDINSWKSLCREKVSPLLPQKFKMKVFVWKKKWDGDDMHARYILTELGGIRYDYGLDEGWVGTTTDVELMAPEVYEKRWKDFQEKSSAFKPGIIFEIGRI